MSSKLGLSSGLAVGANVFVPGAHCFGKVSVVHGGTASHLVVPGARAAKVDVSLGERGVLFALAATALHAVNIADASGEALVVGHGALGRLIARILVSRGVTPTVWETNPIRATGAHGYAVLAPDADARRDYKHIVDVSGDSKALELARSSDSRRAVGSRSPVFTTRSASRFRRPSCARRSSALPRNGRRAISAPPSPSSKAAPCRSTDLSPTDATRARLPEAYPVAFEDPACVKMVLDWSAL